VYTGSAPGSIEIILYGFQAQHAKLDDAKLMTQLIEDGSTLVHFEGRQAHTISFEAQSQE